MVREARPMVVALTSPDLLLGCSATRDLAESMCRAGDDSEAPPSR